MPDPRSAIRQAVRRLRRSPGFAITALLTLAVGIGANAAIFSLVYTVLLKPLPYPDADRIVGLWHSAPGLGFDELNQSPATYLTYRADSRLLEEVALWDNETVSLSGRGTPEEVDAFVVTDGFFPILGTTPALGRLITADDDAPGAPLTVLLGHGYWQRSFGGDRSVIGQTLTMDGRLAEIIGVLPEDFRFLDFDPAIVYPLRLDPAEVFLGMFNYQGIGRMAPGVTPEQVARELDPMVRVALERYPGPLTESMLDQARFGQVINPLHEDVVGDLGGVLWILLGTVGVVLLIACANVANLFLVRAQGRVRDIAVRSAVGASRGHVAGQFLTESVLLGVAAGVVGLGLAWGAQRLLVALSPPIPRLHEVGITLPVVGYTLLVSVLVGLLFGGVALLRYGRPNLSVSLKEGMRGSTDGRERHRAQRSLVVVQVSLALVLLVAAGLLVRTFQEMRRVDPGFSAPEEVFTFRVGIPGATVPDVERVAAMQEEIHRRLGEIPGVVTVGASSSVTMDRADSNDPVFIEEFPTEPGQLPPIRRLKYVLPGYFEAIGNRVVAGRTITWDEIRNHADVAIVTEDFAREYWADPAAALDKRISMFSMDGSTRWRRIIGVVGNAYDDGVDQGPVATVYWPAILEEVYGAELYVARSLVYTLRMRPGTIDAVLPRVQEAVWAVDPSLPLANARTLAEIQNASMERTSFALTMLAIAAAVALFLGAVGLYGTVSYSVTQRIREIGVRIALGARQADVSRMVVGQGMALAAIGVAIGLAGAIGLSRLMRSLLYGVQPADPITFAGVAVLLATVSLLASWIPARRAAALDPGSTLRRD